MTGDTPRPARAAQPTTPQMAQHAGGPVSAQTPTQQAETCWQRALADLQQQRLPQALDALQWLRNAEPHDLLTILWLDVLAQTGQTGQAQQWLAAQNKPKGMFALLARHFRLQSALQFPEPVTRAAPPPSAALLARCDSALLLFQQGEVLAALRAAWRLTTEYPMDVFGWKLLGATLSSLHLWHSAQAAMQQALRLQPGDVEVWNNLGMLLAQTGRLPAAQQCLQQAVSLNPNRYPLQVNLGCILNDLDRLAEAAQCLRVAMTLAPDAAEVLNNLGNILRRQGDLDAAQSLLRQAVQRHPHNPVSWNNLGCVLRDLHQDAEAEQLFRQAMACATDHPETFVNLAGVLQRQQQLDAAADVLAQAQQRWPLDASICSQLALLHRQRGQAQQALEPYLAALALAPEHPLLQADLAAQLLALARPAEAEVLLVRALASQPGLMIAYRHLALALRQQGRLHEARAVLCQGLQQQPAHAATLSDLGTLLLELGESTEAARLLQQAHQLAPHDATLAMNLAECHQMQGHTEETEALVVHALAQVQPANPAPILASAMLMLPRLVGVPHLPELEALYTRKHEWAQADQIRYSMALGKVREMAGDAQGAFAAYAAGNQILAALQPFDTAADAALFARIQTFYTPDLFDRWAAHWAQVAPDARTPTFIVGMPRSGTSLVEQILSSHPAVHGLGESQQMNAYSAEASACLTQADDHAAAQARLQDIATRYLHEMWQQAPDKQIVTDKMPENFLHLGLIALLLPQAKIIHCQRSPMDTCFSCFATPFRTGHLYRSQQETLAGRYRRYHDLMAHWQQTLSPQRLFTVRYEALVANPEPVMRQMLAFLGLPWDARCLQFHQTARLVRTASVTQVRQPLYDQSIGRWRRFAPWLAPLWEQLADLEGAAERGEG